ncbi:MAG: SdiA-regulated domain-containing protein [Candidatus Tenebribacter davisii]|jgi:hypothetical protein|nr:SdiA-regulated domain-containing protein [Candidatus Tenebribacter davisii]
MKKKCSFNFLMLLIVLLTACSTIETRSYRIPDNLNIIQKIKTDNIPQKCLYSAINKTAFILEKENNKIQIYKNGKKINTVGGFGVSNFNNIADITLAPDDNLLVLDSFQKKIIKIDINGEIIAEIKLTGFNEPTLFAVTAAETYYIFDNALKEIVITRTFDETDRYTFGKFQLEHPYKMDLGKDIITVYDKQKNTTMIFGILGHYQDEIIGNIQINKYQKFILRDYYIYHPETEKKFAVSTNKWNDFSLKDNVILLSDNEIWIGKFSYIAQNER